MPFGISNSSAPDDELGIAAARRDPVDALEAEPPLARMPEAGHAAVPRVGEVDRAARVDADVVRAVQLLALELLGDDLARPVRALAHERARHVLADEQVEIGVVGHPVALVREVPDLDDRAVGRVLAPDVAGHVREEQVVLRRVPDRPLREREAGRDPLDLRALLDELVDRVRLRLDAEAGFGARHRAPFRLRECSVEPTLIRAPRLGRSDQQIIEAQMAQRPHRPRSATSSAAESRCERLRLHARLRWPETAQSSPPWGSGSGDVLDLGCGGGAVTLEIARLVGASGHVSGSTWTR